MSQQEPVEDTIQRITQLLNSGVSQSSTDGTLTSFDNRSLRMQLDQLTRRSLANIVSGEVRPPMFVTVRMPYES